MKLPLYGVAASNWNYANGTWPKFGAKGGNELNGYCEYDDNVYPLGPRFDLQLLKEELVVLISSNNCTWEHGEYRHRGPVNKTIAWGWSKFWINKTTVDVGNWDLTGIKATYIDFCDKTQLVAYKSSGVSEGEGYSWEYGWYQAGKFLGANLTATIGPCKLPKGYWWLCGDGYSRKQLPGGWKGTCTIGYLTSQDTVFNQSEIPSGMLRTPWRRIRGVENPLVTRGTRFHSFVRWFIPFLGVSELEKAIVNISATIEVLEKSTIDAIQALQQEIQSLANVVGQNRMALDLLTWKEGGLCAVINQSCCSYVNQNGRIEKDLQNLIAKTQILHLTAQDDTTFGFSDLWEKLTSWLPNLAWLKRLFLLLVAILMLGTLVCALIRCLMCCTRGAKDEYIQWKKHQLRERVESGKYFRNQMKKESVL